MKTIKLSLLVMLLAIITSCQKPSKKEAFPPEPVYFEIVNQNGQSLITSKSDSVTISYIDQGVTKYLHTGIFKLYANATDTTSSSNYNGLFISDNKGMALLGMQANPITNFTLTLNGANLGNIYFDYYPYLTVYPKLSSSYFTFNNVPVISDRNAGYETIVDVLVVQN